MATSDFMARLDVAVGALIVQSGDVLVIGLARDGLSLADADRYRDEVKRRLPGIGEVVVLAGVNALAAYRPDDPEARS